eukprot:3643111-Pyramimonas_sp.AAC.1
METSKHINKHARHTSTYTNTCVGMGVGHRPWHGTNPDSQSQVLFASGSEERCEEDAAVAPQRCSRFARSITRNPAHGI